MDDRLKKVADVFAEEFELIEGDKFVDENEEYLDFFRDVSFWISEKIDYQFLFILILILFVLQIISKLSTNME